LTISLPEDRLQRLKERAARFRIAAEELVRAGIEELLTRPDEEFQRALTYVLTKHAELCRRLASCAFSRSVECRKRMSASSSSLESALAQPLPVEAPLSF
jgi:hypothetical protein